VLELLPWKSPFLLNLVSKKLPDGEQFTTRQRDLVATIVHNAGIYNGILAAGLLWAALAGESANDVARVLLAGAAVAGIFGTVTMRSVPTAVQAVLGIIGLLFV
jgi:putative membrane protein